MRGDAASAGAARAAGMVGILARVPASIPVRISVPASIRGRMAVHMAVRIMARTVIITKAAIGAAGVGL